MHRVCVNILDSLVFDRISYWIMWHEHMSLHFPAKSHTIIVVIWCIIVRSVIELDRIINTRDTRLFSSLRMNLDG
jgi:hypothetical protein